MLKEMHGKYADKLGSAEHEKLLNVKREKYASNRGTVEHKIKLVQKQKNYNTSKVSAISDIDKRIQRFKELIMKGPYYICVVCNRCLYKRSVVVFKEDKYESLNSKFYFSHIQNFNRSQYICLTCHRKLKSKKNLIPYHAVCNKLEVYSLPHNLNRYQSS